MAIEVKALPAKNGDCILVNYDADTKRHMLIDCGYVDTFRNYLANELLDISRDGYSLDNLILTHIDADHIQGAVAFLKANNEKKIIDIKSIWHNTFRHLFKLDTIENDRKSLALLERIIKRGYNEREEKKSGEISAEQGTSVGALVLKGDYPWNTEFSSQAVVLENRQEIILDSISKIFLLSPDNEKLQKLKKLWNEELIKYDIKYSKATTEFYDDAFEMLMSWEPQKTHKYETGISASSTALNYLLSQTINEDSTVTNGSSIAFVLFIKDQKLLFLGDAHPDIVFKSLCSMQPEGKVIFDLIKVSHHGCFANVNTDLLQKIDAKKYLILTDGSRHNHPDKETVAHIIGRQTDGIREMYFNYRTKNSEFFNRDDWKTKYGYSINYLDSPPYSIVIK